MIFNINSTRGQMRFLTCVARVTCLVRNKRSTKLGAVAVLARFCPPGRNRAAEILSARAAEIPFSPSFSPMGRNCLVVHVYHSIVCLSSRWGTFFGHHFLHFAISYISWLIHQLAYAQSMCRGSSVWLHH